MLPVSVESGLGLDQAIVQVAKELEKAGWSETIVREIKIENEILNCTSILRSIYNKKNTGIQKKAGYRGCIAVCYGDYRIFDEMMLIIKRFIGLKI